MDDARVSGGIVHRPCKAAMVGKMLTGEPPQDISSRPAEEWEHASSDMDTTPPLASAGDSPACPRHTLSIMIS